MKILILVFLTCIKIFSVIQLCTFSSYRDFCSCQKKKKSNPLARSLNRNIIYTFSDACYSVSFSQSHSVAEDGLDFTL